MRMLLSIALAVLGCGAPEARTDVSYDERFGESTTMDVYLPDDDGAAHPAILLVHGGSWQFGSKRAYDGVAKRFARSGYVAATINYRLAEEGRYPNAIRDCMCALSYLRANATAYHLDPRRVGAMGYSAGGHLVALMGVAGAEHTADCPNGPTTPPNAVIAGAANPDFRGKDRDVVRDFLGGTESERPDVYRDASPLTHVGPNKPPFLFVLGGADVANQQEKNIEMRDALRAHGNVADVLLVDGGGHVLNYGPSPGELHVDVATLSPESWLAIVDFLERSL
jgi:acetyl esterase/lipase